MKFAVYMTLTDTYLTVVEAESEQEAKAKLIDGDHGEPVPYPRQDGSFPHDGQWMPHMRRQFGWRLEKMQG